MAETKTATSHLSISAARGLGEPDTVLLVGGTRFPVHSAVVSRGSGVLRQLLSDFGAGSGGGGDGGGDMGQPPEICLFPSADAASVPSFASAASLNEVQLALVSHPGHFAAYLARLYSPTGSAPLANWSAARGLLTLADFYDSPQLLPEIDNNLVGHLSTGESGSWLIQLGGYGSSTFYLTTAGDIDEFLELARDFQLRRTMAEVLSVLSVGHLLGSFRGKKQVVKALDTLDAVPLAQLVKLKLKQWSP